VDVHCLHPQLNLRCSQTPKPETCESAEPLALHCPLIYFAASVPAVCPVIEPRIKPEPLG